MDLTIYAPFTLLLLMPAGPAVSIFWNGRGLSSPTHPTAPLVSSGHDPIAVPKARQALWQKIERVDRESCLDFHRSHEPKKGAESPCMHRPDARSVSLTHIVVDAQQLTMSYADGPPCRSGFDAKEQLKLAVPLTSTRLDSLSLPLTR